MVGRSAPAPAPALSSIAMRALCSSIQMRPPPSSMIIDMFCPASAMSMRWRFDAALKDICMAFGASVPKPVMA